MTSILTISLGIIILILLFSALRYRENTKQFIRLVGRLGIRFCLAALGIYLLNWAIELVDFDFRLAINPVTVGVVAILGMPGMISLAIIKYLIA